MYTQIQAFGVRLCSLCNNHDMAFSRYTVGHIRKLHCVKTTSQSRGINVWHVSTFNNEGMNCRYCDNIRTVLFHPKNELPK